MIGHTTSEEDRLSSKPNSDMVDSFTNKSNGQCNTGNSEKHCEQDSPAQHEQNTSQKGVFRKISSAIIWALETAFYNVGLFVGKYPVLSIVIPIIMCGLCGLGMAKFSPGGDQAKFWVPSKARVVNEKKWMEKAFPQETRFVSVLVVQEGNIFTPAVMNALMGFYKESLKIEVGGQRFPQFCVRLGQYCYVSSLLELWYYDEKVIRNLTTSDILHKISTTKTVPISGVEVKTLIGGNIRYDVNGSIIEAEATQITWVTKEETSKAESFEVEMIDLTLDGCKGLDNLYVYATRSFDDEGYGAVNSDTKLLTAGFSIVFVFIMLSLGKFNLLEQKVSV